MVKLLLLEDDDVTAEAVPADLRERGFAADRAVTGTEGRPLRAAGRREGFVRRGRRRRGRNVWGPRPPVRSLADLVDNALKFCPSGGSCALTLCVEGDSYVLGVRDEGSCISASERDKVLKRFYRGEASRSSEGSGLGLSLVAALTRLHGFTLTLADARPRCSAGLRCPAGPALY